MNTHAFFQDLAVILVAVGLVSAVFSRFGLPKVIGYILAGTLLGEHTFGGPFVIDQNTVAVLGQIGVVFLMFALGLEFNIRKLKRVGHVAFPTAALDMMVMVWTGHFVGTKIFGWGSVQSLFLGAAISDSATTLLAKTINDMGWGTRRFTKYIFGITIAEDIICIVVLALLTGFVSSGTVDVKSVVGSMGGLLLFLTGVIVFGLLLVPKVMNRVGRLKDDEALLLTILGFCFLVSFVADRLNFSLALGAFFIGVVAAESEPLERIYAQCVPLRTMFSAIFFVTIGLLVDPVQMLVHWQAILGLSVVVVLFKGVNCTVGALLTGQDFKNALQTGIGLAQVGEFAYLVALIAVTSGAAADGLYQIAVGVSVLTTILNPFFIRASDPLADWAIRRMPQRIKVALATYSDWVSRFLHTRTSDTTTRALRFNLALIALQFALVAVFFVAAGMLAKLDYTLLSPAVEAYKRTLLWSLACLAAVPNAVILFFRARILGGVIADTLIRGDVSQTRWTGALRRGFGLLSIAGTLAAFFVVVSLLSGSVMPDQMWARGIVVLTLLVVGFFGWKRFRRLGAESLETLRNVLAQETQERLTEPFPSPPPALLPAEHARLAVHPSSAACGRSLRELDLRARSGASVVGVERDGTVWVNPAADERLEQEDVLLLLGDEEQIKLARDVLS